MADYLLLMHAGPVTAEEDWGRYLGSLRAKGAFLGGSAIGGGLCVAKAGDPPAITGHLGGYIKVTAENLDGARVLLAGNPVYEAGGVVEIRELPVTG